MMHITSKGQVTIPLAIRQKLGFHANSEVDFIEESGRVYLQKTAPSKSADIFEQFRGCATIKMSTDEIMTMTREH